MTNWYLIPAKVEIINGETEISPKYVSGSGLSWVSMDMYEQYGFFLVKVVLQNQSQDNDLVSNPDVIKLDNSAVSRGRVQKALNIQNMDEVSEDIDIIGKLLDPKFNKKMLRIYGED